MRAGLLTLYLLLGYQHVCAQCRTEVTEAPILRLESRAEQIADLRLICAGLAPPGLANFTVTLSSPIATPLTGVRLEVGEPPVSYNPTPVGTHQLRFPNVTLPGGVNSAVRITGLRVDLAGFDATLRANPPTVRATLSAGPISISSPELITGYPTPSLSATLIDGATNQPTSALVLRPGTALGPTHSLLFRERFRGAFRTRSQEPIAPHGTLLVAEFSNLPPGAGISIALVDSMNHARLVESEANPVPIFHPTAPYFPLPISNGSATAVWEVTQNASPDSTYSFAISATGPAQPVGAGLRYGPTQSPALARFESTAKLDPLDCQVNCFSVPAVMSFTRRFGQPPPPNANLPVEFNGTPFPLQAQGYAESSQLPFLIAPLGNTFEFQFVQSPLAPGRYTTIVDVRPAAGGPRRYTLVVLTVTPPAPNEAQPLLCQPSAAGPASLRAEGLTEPVADVLLHCTGGQPGQLITTTIRVNYNAVVTGRDLDPTSIRGSEALLFLDDPSQRIPAVNEFPNGGPAAQYYVEFLNVTLQIPASQRFQLRVSNVRLDARTVARHFTSTQPLIAQATVFATGPLAIPQTTLNVGAVEPAFDFTLRDHLDRPAYRITPSSLAANQIHQQLVFREGSPAAFRRRNAATSFNTPLALTDQIAPGIPFLAETMVYSAARGLQGLAAQGTRLEVNIPYGPGVRVFVTLNPLPNSSGTIKARLLQHFPNGSGDNPFDPIPQQGVAQFGGVALPIAEIGSYPNPSAVWEVLESSPLHLEELRFGVVAIFPEAEGEIRPVPAIVPRQYSTGLPRFDSLDYSPFQRIPCSTFDCLQIQGYLHLVQAPGPLVVERIFPIRTQSPGAYVRYDASTNVPWIKLDRPIAFSSSPLRFTTDATNLPPGTHHGHIRLGDTTHPVSLTIQTPTGGFVDDLSPTIIRTAQRVFAGNQALLDFTVTTPGGLDRFGIFNVLINSALDGARACYIAYSHPAQALFLVNDNGPAAGLSSPLIPGSSGQVSNGQCTLHGAGTIIDADPRTALRLRLNLTFANSFSGSKAIYAAARTVDEQTKGWALSGYIDIPEPPSFPRAIAFPPALPFNPNDGQPVEFRFEDATDANNLETVWGLINSAVDASKACYFSYYVPGNLLFLYPDNGDGAAARSISLNSSQTISNSQCTVLAAGANVVKSGNQLRLTLRLYLQPELRRAHGIWGAAKSLNNPQASPWKLIGQP